jgi:hypothetical protein
MTESRPKNSATPPPATTANTQRQESTLMILYDFACETGHRFEAGIATMSTENPCCPSCGRASRRRPSRVQLGNRASAGPSREQMPHSWTATGHGDPETIKHWHDLATKREKLEESYPELAGDRRPVLAHEGIFSDNPLRAGDDISSAVAKAVAAAPAGGQHTHSRRATMPATSTKANK